MQPYFSAHRFRSRLRRRSQALAVSLALSLVSTPVAHAAGFFDPTAALRVAILARIATITGRIHAVCDAIAHATRSIQERQEVMFPLESLGKLGSVFQTVRSLREDLDDLTAQYSLRFDADEFRRSLTGDQPLTRGTLEALWGRATGPSRDLDEYATWSAHRRHLSASSVLSVNDQWQDAANKLAHEARSGAQASAGRSIRLSAVAAAMGLQQATAANKLAAERLDAAQEALDFERYDDLLANALGDVLLAPFDRTRASRTQIPGVPDDVRIGGVL